MDNSEKILIFLRKRGDWVYGLDIANELKFNVIPTLHKLLREGRAEAQWREPASTEPNAPRRRYYKAKAE